MRALVQRVTEAEVAVGDRVAGSVGPGLLVPARGVGVRRAGGCAPARRKMRRAPDLRPTRWQDEPLPQADRRRGADRFAVHPLRRRVAGEQAQLRLRRAAGLAERLYEEFLAAFRAEIGRGEVRSGVFRAMMKIRMTNDGPVHHHGGHGGPLMARAGRPREARADALFLRRRGGIGRREPAVNPFFSTPVPGSNRSSRPDGPGIGRPSRRTAGSSVVRSTRPLGGRAPPEAGRGNRRSSRARTAARLLGRLSAPFPIHAPRPPRGEEHLPAAGGAGRRRCTSTRSPAVRRARGETSGRRARSPWRGGRTAGPERAGRARPGRALVGGLHGRRVGGRLFGTRGPRPLPGGGGRHGPRLLGGTISVPVRVLPHRPRRARRSHRERRRSSATLDGSSAPWPADSIQAGRRSDHERPRQLRDLSTRRHTTNRSRSSRRGLATTC